MSTTAASDASHGRKRALGAMAIMIPFAVVIGVFAPPVADLLLLILLAVLWGLELMALTVLSDAEHPPASWRLISAFVTLASALAIAGAGAVLLVSGGAAVPILLVGILVGAIVGGAVVWLLRQLPTQPQTARHGLANIAGIMVGSGVIAVAHTAGIIVAGTPATIVAGAYLGNLVAIGAYASGMQFRHGPHGVFPGLNNQIGFT